MCFVGVVRPESVITRGDRQPGGEKEEDEGDDREHAVEVGGAHVLADGLVHGELAQHGARGEGDVGEQRAVQRLVRERELLERSNRDRQR